MEVVVVVEQRVAELTGVKGEAAADMVEREVVSVVMVWRQWAKAVNWRRKEGGPWIVGLSLLCPLGTQ